MTYSKALQVLGFKAFDYRVNASREEKRKMNRAHVKAQLNELYERSWSCTSQHDVVFYDAVIEAVEEEYKKI